MTRFQNNLISKALSEMSEFARNSKVINQTIAQEVEVL